MKLYPLKFQPIYKDKIWGGQKIRNILNKDFGNLPNCGETWEISGVEDNVSQVINGKLKGCLFTDLIKEYKSDLVGKRVYEVFGNKFPILIKFIDANDDLSIQVHPNDALAYERHNSFGKTEMWYVIQADKGATLISGFNRNLNKEEYLQSFNSGELETILNKESVEKDDVFFLPAGRVHTIGKGLLIAEIQQTSDITYRIYDFDRVDEAGNKRELHVDEAIDAIDFKLYPEYKTNYNKKKLGSVDLVSCNYFETHRLNIDGVLEKRLKNIDSFVIYIVLDGEGNIEFENKNVTYKKGECILVPACIDKLCIRPKIESKILETFIPNKKL